MKDGRVLGVLEQLLRRYPMTMLRSRWYSEAIESKSLFGVPRLEEGVLDAHSEEIGKGGAEMVISAEPSARLDLAIVMVQKGRWIGIFGRDDGGEEGLWLEDLIEEKKIGEGEGEKKAPFLFLFRGTKDTAVSVEDFKRMGGGLGEGV